MIFGIDHWSYQQRDRVQQCTRLVVGLNSAAAEPFSDNNSIQFNCTACPPSFASTTAQLRHLLHLRYKSIPKLQPPPQLHHPTTTPTTTTTMIAATTTTTTTTYFHRKSPMITTLKNIQEQNLNRTRDLFWHAFCVWEEFAVKSWRQILIDNAVESCAEICLKCQRKIRLKYQRETPMRYFDIWLFHIFVRLSLSLSNWNIFGLRYWWVGMLVTEMLVVWKIGGWHFGDL